MSGLHKRLRTAVEDRKVRATAAAKEWPSIIGIVEGDPPFVAPDYLHDHIGAENPDATILHCQADLALLEAHRPCHCLIAAPGGLAHCFNHCPGEMGAEVGKRHWPCAIIANRAAAYGISIDGDTS